MQEHVIKTEIVGVKQPDHKAMSQPLTDRKHGIYPTPGQVGKFSAIFLDPLFLFFLTSPTDVPGRQQSFIQNITKQSRLSSLPIPSRPICTYNSRDILHQRSHLTDFVSLSFKSNRGRSTPQEKGLTAAGIIQIGASPAHASRYVMFSA